MLSKIKIKNFKSIQELELDLSFAEGKAPNGYKESDIISFLEPTSKSKDRLVSVMNLYGANASGKSNIVEALANIKRIIRKGINSKCYNPNRLKSLENETLVELDFFIDGNSHKYTLAYNRNTITKEILSVENKVIFSIKENKANFENIETKVYKKKELQEIFKVACLEKGRNLTTSIYFFQVNTFLNSVVSKLPGLNKKISDTFNFLERDLTVVRDSSVSINLAINNLAKSDKEEDVKESFTKISNLIKKLDIDIEQIIYKRPDSKEKFNKKEINFFGINLIKNTIERDDITTYHKNEKGEIVEFEFKEESLGTKLVFGIAGMMLKTLEDGGVLIIDELDRSLHPMLLNVLIRMFKDKQYNKNNAQLISVLHTTDILEDDIYKISEFAFVNKNLKRGSFIKRLFDVEGIRNDMNFRDRYLNGEYFGIPYPHN